MPLNIIGIGLSDEKDISIKGLELVKNADLVYLETYTSKLGCTIQDLEKFYAKKIIPADRTLVEQNAETTILKEAKTKQVAFLVPGDALAATTHADLVLRAKKQRIPVAIVHNASVFSAVGATGLQLYKFGKTTSIPFPEGNYLPETPYDVLKENKSIGAHTLFLLDLRPEQNKYMAANEAINYLLTIELKRNEKLFTPETLCVACARLGAKDQLIRAGKAKNLLKENLGKPIHCLIVPGKLHFMEEEFLKEFY